MASRANDEVRLLRAMRLHAQGLVPGSRPWATPADVARGMLAMQAQDPKGVLWALATRAGDDLDEDAVLAALADRSVVRNRPSRGTLQVTAPEDLHWLTATMSPRSIAAAEKRRADLGVTDELIESVGEVLRSELAGGAVRTRPELVEAAAAAGIELDGGQTSHVLGHHTQIMTIVFATPEGRTDTFALADEWIAERRDLDRAEALGELARRFVAARGPVLVHDLARWANLTVGDARAGVEAAGDAVRTLTLAGDDLLVAVDAPDLDDAAVDETLAAPLLLAPFDEYLLGYGARDAIIEPEHLDAVVPGGNGMFKPIVVVDGEIVGIWSRKLTAKKVTVTLAPFGSWSSKVRRSLEAPAEAYATFLDRELVLADA